MQLGLISATGADLLYQTLKKSSKLQDEVLRLGGDEVGSLLNEALIVELRASGVKFTEADLKFVVKNNDGFIMFLESGNSSAGLQHIIDGKWTGKPSFQALFNNNIDEMISSMHEAINHSDYVEKIIDEQGRLSYIYEIQTTQGLRKFKFATGSNGYIVSFIPDWL